MFQNIYHNKLKVIFHNVFFLRIGLAALAITTIAGCNPHNLKSVNYNTLILGIPVPDTVLVLDETYFEGKDGEDYTLPKGLYQPVRIQRGDWLQYEAPQKIRVGFMIFSGSTECYGGIMVKQNSPYQDYKMYAVNCQNEPVFTGDLESRPKFRIVKETEI